MLEMLTTLNNRSVIRTMLSKSSVYIINSNYERSTAKIGFQINCSFQATNTKTSTDKSGTRTHFSHAVSEKFENSSNNFETFLSRVGYANQWLLCGPSYIMKPF